jgi:alginate lyase
MTPGGAPGRLRPLLSVLGSLVVLAGSIAVVGAVASRSNAPGQAACAAPSDVLDLTGWKVTLPTGQSEPDEIEQPDLTGFSADPWFVPTEDCTGIRFRSAVNGVTTANSKNPRSELREMIADGSNEAEWAVTTGTHTMTVRGMVTHLPEVKPHVVAAQVHGGSDDLTAFRLEGSSFYVTDGDDTHANLVTDSYELGTPYELQFVAGNGEIQAYFNGQLAATIPSDSTTAYFKTGAYTQAHCENSSPCDETNYGETVICGVEVSHDGAAAGPTDDEERAQSESGSDDSSDSSDSSGSSGSGDESNSGDDASSDESGESADDSSSGDEASSDESGESADDSSSSGGSGDEASSDESGSGDEASADDSGSGDEASSEESGSADDASSGEGADSSGSDEAGSGDDSGASSDEGSSSSGSEGGSSGEAGGGSSGGSGSDSAGASCGGDGQGSVSPTCPPTPPAASGSESTSSSSDAGDESGSGEGTSDGSGDQASEEAGSDQGSDSGSSEEANDESSSDEGSDSGSGDEVSDESSSDEGSGEEASEESGSDEGSESGSGEEAGDESGSEGSGSGSGDEAGDSSGSSESGSGDEAGDSGSGSGSGTGASQPTTGGSGTAGTCDPSECETTPTDSPSTSDDAGSATPVDQPDDAGTGTASSESGSGTTVKIIVEITIGGGTGSAGADDVDVQVASPFARDGGDPAPSDGAPSAAAPSDDAPTSDVPTSGGPATCPPAGGTSPASDPIGDGDSTTGSGSGSAPQAIGGPGRIAYAADGNQHDPDDHASSAMALALLASEGLQANLVNYTYNNHIWDSDPAMVETMTESVMGSAERFGFDTSVFFDASNPQGLDAGVADLTADIDASTADDELTLALAGPMETAWMALDAADPEARTHVRCVSHGENSWNKTHGAEDHGGHTYDDLIELGCQRVVPPDQNGELGPSDMGPWEFLREMGDPNMEWLYERIDAAGGIGDVSDAGMIYFAITGNEAPTRDDLRSMLTGSGSGSSGSADPGGEDGAEAEAEA